jgi:hypothetical protein
VKEIPAQQQRSRLSGLAITDDRLQRRDQIRPSVSSRSVKALHRATTRLGRDQLDQACRVKHAKVVRDDAERLAEGHGKLAWADGLGLHGLEDLEPQRMR